MASAPWCDLFADKHSLSIEYFYFEWGARETGKCYRFPGILLLNGV